MNFTGKLIMNVYSIFILLMILYRLPIKEKDSPITFNIYKNIVRFTIFMLIIDITGRLNGNRSLAYVLISPISNFLVFSFNLIIPSLWLLYVHAHIYPDKRNKSLFKFLLGLNILNIIILIISQPYGWIYYIDENNIYHRGPFYILTVLMTIILVMAAFILVARNRTKIQKRHYFALQFFSVPPMLGVLLQAAFFNISVALNSLVLSIFLVFLNIQSITLNTDYLTGVSNRSNFEIALANRIMKSTKDKSFSGIMIDLNDFKSINDKFGHDIGDDALKTSAQILINSIRAQDLVARFGGDEFCAILDISDQAKLEAIVERINKTVEDYNESRNMPYKLKFSMGYAVYDYKSGMTAEEFKKHIDELMYKDKQELKENSTIYSSTQ